MCLSNVLFKRLFLALLFMLASIANADKANTSPETSTQNSPKVIAPQVEVVEFFWYGCGICNVLEPHANEWKKSLPENVIFTKIPAFTGGLWDIHGKIYFTLQAMNVDYSIHTAVFNAIHTEDKSKQNILRNDKEITAFLVANNLDTTQFFKIYNSSGIKLQIDRARALFRSYKLTGTPAFVVAKKHHLAIENDGIEGLFKRLNQAIEAELKALK